MEHQVADRLQDSIATTVQLKSMDAIQWEIDSADSQKKSTLTGLVSFLTSRVMTSRDLESYLEMGFGNIADSTIFEISILCSFLTSKYFRTSAEQLAKGTVPEQVQVATVHARLQEAIHAPQVMEKLEPVKVPSLPG